MTRLASAVGNPYFAGRLPCEATMNCRSLPMLAGILACGALLAACTSSGTELADRERLRSNPVVMTVDLGADALGGARNLMMRAFATCTEERCPGEFVELAISNQGSTPLRGFYRTLRVWAGPMAMTWDDLPFGTAGQASIPTGEFLRVDVDPEFFRMLAEEPRVIVELGSVRFQLDYTRRATFRQMARQMGLTPPVTENR